ncbi:hypothetical protein [Halomonas icarae]|uniref:Uncharacterized protein n=1 Tax=Halomonas icarae TaxID=2691040 RepID=A0A7X4VW77_9GAMM|nr:hypothetical protein [Halomonas icarae]MDR5901045.1 hypothetical protein [Halomonas icarae]NAW11321.1 hypothetical protein [Halomonas icarae]
MANKEALPPHQPASFDEAFDSLLLHLGEVAKPGETRTREERLRSGELTGIVDLLRWLLRLAELMRKSKPDIACKVARRGYFFDHQQGGALPGIDVLIEHLRRVAATYLRLDDVPIDPFNILELWDDLTRGFDPIENRFDLPDEQAPQLLILDWNQGHTPRRAADRLAVEVGLDPLPDVLMDTLYTASSLLHTTTHERFELLAYRLCEALRHMAMIQREREKTLNARRSRKHADKGASGNARPAELFALEYLEANHTDPASGRVRQKRAIAKEIHARINEEFTQPGDWAATHPNALRMIEAWITPRWQQLKHYQRMSEALAAGQLERQQQLGDK